TRARRPGSELPYRSHRLDGECRRARPLAGRRTDRSRDGGCSACARRAVDRVDSGRPINDATACDARSGRALHERRGALQEYARPLARGATSEERGDVRLAPNASLFTQSPLTRRSSPFMPSPVAVCLLWPDLVVPSTFAVE